MEMRTDPTNDDCGEMTRLHMPVQVPSFMALEGFVFWGNDSGGMLAGSWPSAKRGAVDRTPVAGAIQHRPIGPQHRRLDDALKVAQNRPALSRLHRRRGPSGRVRGQFLQLAVLLPEAHPRSREGELVPNPSRTERDDARSAARVDDARELAADRKIEQPLGSPSRPAELG